MIIENNFIPKSLTLSTDTNAYAATDLIADVQIIEGVTRANNVPFAPYSLTVIDGADQGAPLNFFFVRVSTTWGTENDAPSQADSVSNEVIGRARVLASDYDDVGGAKIACVRCEGGGLPVADSDDIYIVCVSGGGTPTYAAASLKLNMLFLPG